MDISRVIKMLLIHDLVEIEASDAPIFGHHNANKSAHEEATAATRIFGLLPPDQACNLRQLWNKFEAATSPDAQFAKSMDQFQPPNQNLASGNGTWAEYNVTLEQIEIGLGSKIAPSAPARHGIDLSRA